MSFVGQLDSSLKKYENRNFAVKTLLSESFVPSFAMHCAKFELNINFDTGDFIEQLTLFVLRYGIRRTFRWSAPRPPKLEHSTQAKKMACASAQLVRSNCAPWVVFEEQAKHLPLAAAVCLLPAAFELAIYKVLV